MGWASRTSFGYYGYDVIRTFIHALLEANAVENDYRYPPQIEYVIDLEIDF